MIDLGCVHRCNCLDPRVFFSAQRLHALQLELTAVQLLRQQLEDSIRTNEELRDDLEREIQRTKLREGAVQTRWVVDEHDK